MPRAIWFGSVLFGLVSVPVRMFSAIDEKDVYFHLFYRKDDSRIGYEKVCKKEDKAVPDDEIGTAYEISKGKYVYLEDDDFEAAASKGYRTFDLADFVPLDEIDPMVFERTYYLGPAEGAERVYALLARALESTGLVGVASFVFHDRDQLACLRVKDGAILLERMYFADEIRDLKDVLPDKKAGVDKGQLKLAVDLIERMQGSFDHAAYRDRYRDRLMKIVDAKRKGKTISVPEVEERRAPDDLMAALEESLSAAVGKAGATPKGRKAPKAGTKTRAKAAKGRTKARSRSTS